MLWRWILWLLLVCFIVVLVVITWLASAGVVAVKTERVAGFLIVAG